MDLGEQRALQDWYIKFALQTVSGVSEVASFGGFQKQYQVVVDPYKLRYYNIPLMDVVNKIKANNNNKTKKQTTLPKRKQQTTPTTKHN